jgi:hypothetical protein
VHAAAPLREASSPLGRTIPSGGCAEVTPADELAIRRLLRELAERAGPRGPTREELEPVAADISTLVSGPAVRLARWSPPDEPTNWSLRLFLAGELVLEQLPGGWSHSPPPAPDPRSVESNPGTSSRDPHVLSRLLAQAQAQVQATRQPLTADRVARLVAQEPALAGATIERDPCGELVINLADGKHWATLSSRGKLECPGSDTPVAHTPPHHSAAFARGRQRFKATVALLARRERRVLALPARSRGARPRAVRFKPRSRARRAARRGATRAGPGDDGDSEGEAEPKGALNRLVGATAGTAPSPTRAHRRFAGRPSRVPRRRTPTGPVPSGGRS